MMLRRADGGRIVAAGMVACLVAGCSSEPFRLVRTSGKLTYEDGSPLPTKKGDPVLLMFLPQIPPLDAKTFPRRGTTVVDPETGTFDSATTHTYGDGLVACRHKVVISGAPNKMPAGVPVEYGSPTTTPLEIDAARQPLHLMIKKPK